MPSARPAGGGGGGGSAYGLGPAPNTFANDTARDAQAADTDWLGQYNDNRSFWIRNGTDIQRRNADGDDWENVTAVVQGPTGADGDDGTMVAANPSGTDGDALTRIAIAGTNYNVQGSGGGMAATWDRRIAPALPIDGYRVTSRTTTLLTGGSFTTNASAPDRFVQLSIPDHLRALVRAGSVGLA